MPPPPFLTPSGTDGEMMAAFLRSVLSLFPGCFERAPSNLPRGGENADSSFYA